MISNILTSVLFPIVVYVIPLYSASDHPMKKEFVPVDTANMFGTVLQNKSMKSAPTCAIECAKIMGCKGFGFNNLMAENNCYLIKNSTLGKSLQNIAENTQFFKFETDLVTYEWVDIMERKYLISKETFNLRNALIYCTSAGGSLIEIATQTKMFGVKQALNMIPPNKYGDIRFWVAATVREPEHVFIWIRNNIKISSSFWLPDEPNNVDQNENCVSFSNTNLNDDNCDKQHIAVCEEPFE